jgi:hypothetical protein
MDNIVIRPFQEEIISCLTEILEFNDIFLELYFVTLQPIEFTELDNISTKVKREEETGEKLSSQEPLEAPVEPISKESDQEPINEEI